MKKRLLSNTKPALILLATAALLVHSQVLAEATATTLENQVYLFQSALSTEQLVWNGEVAIQCASALANMYSTIQNPQLQAGAAGEFTHVQLKLASPCL